MDRMLANRRDPPPPFDDKSKSLSSAFNIRSPESTVPEEQEDEEPSQDGRKDSTFDWLSKQVSILSTGR